MTSPWESEGDWLRCQLHAHTTNSDGEPAPEGLVEHYARAGFDVLAITDHWHITPFEHDGILVIPSAELSGTVEGALEEADVLAYGIDELPEVREHFPSIADAAAWIVAQGGVAYLAHPYWSALSAEHYLEAPGLSGIEVFNGGCEQQQGNGLSVVHWDAILDAGRECHGIATDDSHYAGQDSRLGWTMVRARSRTREAVVEALRSGCFYGTSGPEIRDVRVDAEGVDVRCSPARSVALRSGRWDGCKVNADPRGMNWRGRVTGRSEDGLVTAARFELPEFQGWGRVEVEAADGGRAWSGVVQGRPGQRSPEA
jgi:predicted metal-dependent phosphoesterase TrpH